MLRLVDVHSTPDAMLEARLKVPQPCSVVRDSQAPSINETRPCSEDGSDDFTLAPPPFLEGFYHCDGLAAWLPRLSSGLQLRDSAGL
jgi:hypothetical protein